MQSRLSVWALLVGLAILVAGCVPFWQKNRQPSLVTANGERLHESWCYETLGKIDCYTQPQDLPAGRLVGVNPPIRKPLNSQEYAKALADTR